MMDAQAAVLRKIGRPMAIERIRARPACCPATCW